MEKGTIQGKTRNQDWVHSKGRCKDQTTEREAAEEVFNRDLAKSYAFPVLMKSIIFSACFWKICRVFWPSAVASIAFFISFLVILYPVIVGSCKSPVHYTKSNLSIVCTLTV